MSNFQSYLIVGNNHIVATENLIKSKGAKVKQNSPDFFTISPVKTSVFIDQIRELKNHIFQKPLSLPYKFIVIEQANKMTPQAQNALLKILEEPPTQAIIILQAVDKLQLLPTILSRVVIISSLTERKIEAQSELTLEEIAGIEDPISWLDDKIVGEYHDLVLNITSGKSSKLNKSVKQIRQLAQTKQAIETNVNPKFALANLVLSNITQV